MTDVIETIRYLASQGHSDSAIAAVVGLSMEAVAGRRRRMKIPSGSAAKASALSTEEGSARACDMIAAGIDDRRCAEEFGVSISAFKAWRHRRDLMRRAPQVQAPQGNAQRAQSGRGTWTVCKLNPSPALSALLSKSPHLAEQAMLAIMAKRGVAL
jgi:hypothetical protein